MTGLLVSTGCDTNHSVKNSGQTSSPSKPATVRKQMTIKTGLRGVFFNPYIKSNDILGYYSEYRAAVCGALRDLVNKNINLITVYILVPYTLNNPAHPPLVKEPITTWTSEAEKDLVFFNTSYLKNVLLFVDDCHDAGISVEFDLADNRWVPYSVDPNNSIGKPGSCWPVADDTPWDEAATWYTDVICYIEAHTHHPETIAMWCMTGNYQLGGAEPVMWEINAKPAILKYTEKFVKNVWPAFVAAGKRPKTAPYAFPIFSNDAYWLTKTPEQRLVGFTNVKKWLVDDLKLPPDYWIMTTYANCNPAPDGFYYLRRIVEILGKDNASRIITSDFKAGGHEQEIQASIVPAGNYSASQRLRWNLQKCAEYGFAGWWIWSYQDNDIDKSGIRNMDGTWKTDFMQIIKEFTPAK